MIDIELVPIKLMSTYFKTVIGQSVWRGSTEFVARGCSRNSAHGCSCWWVGNGFDLSVVQNAIILIAIFLQVNFI